MWSPLGRRQLPPPGTALLRVGVAWGTTVLVVRDFGPGQSVAFGDRAECIIPLPDGLNIAPVPIRAVDSEWQIDNYGVTNGLLERGGRREDASRLIPPVRIGPGDWGVLQYGAISLFFQSTEAIQGPGRARRTGTLTGMCVASSIVLHAALFVTLWFIAAPRAVRPTELCNLQQLGERFGLQRWIEDTPVVSTSVESGQGQPMAELPTDYRELADEFRRATASVRSLGPATRPAAQPASMAAAVVEGKTIGLVPATAAVWGGLSKSAVERIATEHVAQLQSCGDAEVVPAGEFRGTVALTLTVGADGVVTAAETSAVPRRPRLEACIVQTTKTTWRFPSSSAPSNVKFTLRLGPVSP